MMNVNYNGPIAHTKAFLPHFLQNKIGHIVIVSSVAGKISASYRTSYGASKSAVLGFFDSLRAEVYNLFLIKFHI